MMIQSERQGYRELMKVFTPYLGVTLAYATLVIVVEESVGDHVYTIAGQMGSVFGIAVAFFLGFRMDSAYDRWWEARKILGELANNTRSFACKVYTYLGNPANLSAEHQTGGARLARELLALTRLYIREFKNELLETSDPDELATQEVFRQYDLDARNTSTNELLLAISAKIEEVFTAGSQLEKSDLMQHLNRFFDIQGKAERIKNTPFLKIYSAFTRLTVLFYTMLIPFFIGDLDVGGEISQLEYLAVPIMALVSSVFLTINTLANLYAEPFSGNSTSLPVEAICEGIDKSCAEVTLKIREP